MAKVKADLRELQKKFGLTKDDVWDCHGTLVMLHRACESVAQQAGIIFDEPKLLYAEGESIAIQVTGRAGEESSWSIGEASPKNNKNSYPWAMAEKRAKDRVILKLARFSEVGVYSDIEADDFRKSINAPKSDDETKHRKAVVATLKEKFGGDDAAIAEWLKEKVLHPVRTANEQQLTEIEKVMGATNE